MKLLTHNRLFLATFVFFPAVATLGIAVELHHCHGLGGSFSTGPCEMSAQQTCSMHSTAARLSTQGTCCESHTFALTSGEPYAPSIQKLSVHQVSKIVSAAAPLISVHFPHIQVSHPLKFLPHAPPRGNAEHIFLLNSSLLI